MRQRPQPAEQVELEARDLQHYLVLRRDVLAGAAAGPGAGSARTRTRTGAGSRAGAVAAHGDAGAGVELRKLLRALDNVLLARGDDVRGGGHQVAVVDQRLPDQS